MESYGRKGRGRPAWLIDRLSLLLVAHRRRWLSDVDRIGRREAVFEPLLQRFLELALPGLVLVAPSLLVDLMVDERVVRNAHAILLRRPPSTEITRGP